MIHDEKAAISKVADACRCGLEGLANNKSSTFHRFPVVACGQTSEIMGRVLSKTLQYHVFFVYACQHPDLNEATHAWYEVGPLFIDITHDQFKRAGLKGWVFGKEYRWHSQFASQKRRPGFASPSDWTGYPNEGHEAATHTVANRCLP
jgi:hypothetical protein